jgi:hypothetical protein
MSALAMNRQPETPGAAGGELAAEVGVRDAPKERTTSARGFYLVLLTWAFALFSSVRVFSYLPTLWAIHASGDSSQHSLVTWITWLGANVTMALWLYEHNGQHFNRAVAVNAANAAMCLVTSLLIGWHRL